MLKLKVPKTLNVKKFRDEKTLALVLSVVAVIYVVMVTGTKNVRSKVVSFYNSKLGLGFAVISSVLAVILPRLLKKQSSKTLILAGVITIVNLFSIAYSASAKEDFLVPTGGTLKFTDEESGNKVSKKFEFTNSDEIDFDGLGSDDDYEDDEDDEDDEDEYEDDEDDEDGGDRYGGIYEDMEKDELKDAKNLLKKEDKKKNKKEIKYIASLIKAMREGGDGSSGAGNDDSGDRYDGKYDDMTKGQLKDEKKRLKKEDKKKNKKEIKYIASLIRAMRNKEDFMNFFRKPEEKKGEKIEEIKCEKKFITPSVLNVSGADIGANLYSLKDFEKKIIV